MEIYVLDYMTLEVKDIFKPLKNNDGSEQYEINLDEETNATSEIMLEYKESIKKGGISSDNLKSPNEGKKKI